MVIYHLILLVTCVCGWTRLEEDRKDTPYIAHLKTSWPNLQTPSYLSLPAHRLLRAVIAAPHRRCGRDAHGPGNLDSNYLGKKGKDTQEAIFFSRVISGSALAIRNSKIPWQPRTHRTSSSAQPRETPLYPHHRKVPALHSHFIPYYTTPQFPASFSLPSCYLPITPIAFAPPGALPSGAPLSPSLTRRR